MALAFLGILSSILLSLLLLAYFNFPGSFLLQLGFSECLFRSPTHALWTALALLSPLLSAPLLWQTSRAFYKFPRHPLFAFHHLVLFLAGLLLANGFFGLRLLGRLDSAPLQAALLVGYLLTLDFGIRILGGQRLAQAAMSQRPLWITMLAAFTLLAAAFTQDLNPMARSEDLGVLRLRFLGRGVWEWPCPVCFSRQTLKDLPAKTNWSSAQLQSARIASACLAWPLSYELPNVWRGCVPSPLRTEIPADGPYPRRWTRLIEGDLSTGEVLFLGQIHQRPEDTPQARWDVFETQAAIYDEIAAQPGLPVFNEATCSGELPLDQHTSERIRMRSSLFARLFQEVGQWSPPYMRLLLASQGAVNALGQAGAIDNLATANCGDPKLDELDRLEDHIEQSDPSKPGYNDAYKKMDAIRFEYREREAISFLQNYFTANPGKKVFLVYGESHRFPVELWNGPFQNKPPRLTFIRWITPLAATWELQDLRDPRARLAWIEDHPAFRLRALGYLRHPAELWAILPKLTPEYLRDSTREEVRQRLITMLEALPFTLNEAEHLRLHEWLWASYHASTGPFHGYVLDTKQAQEFARLDWLAQSKALEDFDHPLQQWQALKSMQRVDLLAYPHLLLPEARLYALDHLEIRPELKLSRQEIEGFLNASNDGFVDLGDKLARRIEALYGSSPSGAAELPR
jgi:hypothetical protein